MMKTLKTHIGTENKDDTASRILGAAEVLFAENGFNGTSARDITRLAKCNVASINYYFHGKDNLYLEVCKRRLNYLLNIRIQSVNDYMSGPAEERTLEGLLLAFSKAFLGPLLDEPKGRYVLKLMMREMFYPKLPANLIFEELIIPMFETLQKAFGEICPGLSEDQALWSMHSLIAQLLHTIHVQGMLSGSEMEFTKEFDIDKAVNHIVLFTAGGMKSLLNNQKQG